MNPRYSASTTWLRRAERVIPLGSQTFSKSRTQYPVGSAPLFAERSHGCHTWDIDGNEYVDLVSALGAVVLGYGDPEVDRAVTRQLSLGVTLSLATCLEAEVAEKIVALIPCAEQVKFAKNGSDVTAAAVRLARAVTGKRHVVAIGYHGWQDWYIGSTSMNIGVPQEVQQLTHTAPYNDADKVIEILDSLEDDVAALILEPMTGEFPHPGYLEALREQTARRNILLVFDEILTGFRVAPGGAQEYFGVLPDLACFGKALGNGHPISALVGPEVYMREFDRIFFSGTFGGETLSLAASSVVLDRIAEGSPLRAIHDVGDALHQGIRHQQSESCRSMFGLSGHPAWLFHKWNLQDSTLLSAAKTLLMQELLRRGILVLSTHNVSEAFNDRDVYLVSLAFGEALELVHEAVSEGRVLDSLQCAPVEPLFSIRR